jgi:membrane protein implicated in regulation of membrane protease activity
MSEPGIPYYVWLIGGLVLCAAETQVPGAFLIWIGIAGLVIGGLEFLWPLSLPAQALAFAALVAALALLGRRVYGSLDRVGPSLPTSRAHALLGREFILDEAINHGFGRIRVDDSVWRVAGEDMPAETRVRVVAIEDGVAIRVQKV